MKTQWRGIQGNEKKFYEAKSNETLLERQQKLIVVIVNTICEESTVQLQK
jgi:hypothetical protein